MSVTQAYDDFINSAHRYDNSDEWIHALEQVPYAQEARYELKRKLFRAVAAGLEEVVGAAGLAGVGAAGVAGVGVVDFFGGSPYLSLAF